MKNSQIYWTGRKVTIQAAQTKQDLLEFHPATHEEKKKLKEKWEKWKDVGREGFPCFYHFPCLCGVNILSEQSTTKFCSCNVKKIGLTTIKHAKRFHCHRNTI